MTWADTGLPWVNPSPNLRSADACLAYPGTCLIEGTIATTLQTRTLHAHEYQLSNPGESPRYFEARMVPSGTDEVLSIVREVTEHHAYVRVLAESNAELERQVAERTAELRLTVAELERANAGKDAFLAAVSHELRTPLTGILGMAELLSMPTPDPLTERQLRYLAGIQQSGDRLLTLISSILHYTALQDGNMPLQRELCGLREIGAITIDSIHDRAEQKHLKVEFRIDQPETVILSDGIAIVHVLQQLLGNAIKFTSAGGRIGLHITYDTAEACVRLAVWDTGIGIASEAHATIFEPFVQEDGTLARRFEGVGLGLAIVRRTVELLGGTICVESELQQGSRFTITLPAA